MEQQYLELYAEQMPDRLELSLMEKKKGELVWEACVRRGELWLDSLAGQQLGKQQG